MTLLEGLDPEMATFDRSEGQMLSNRTPVGSRTLVGDCQSCRKFLCINWI